MEAKSLDPIFRVSGGQHSVGLAKAATQLEGARIETGQQLLSEVVKAVGQLEDAGYVGPYALALGTHFFVIAETPDKNSFVLPSDRIRPIIEGPLVRAGMLPPNTGVLISQAGSLAEIVVASDISVSFLQVTVEPKYVYRVSERIALRIKDHRSLVAFSGPA